MCTLVVFRNDLRLGDQPALHHAIQRRETVIPVYIDDAPELFPWCPGEASDVWRHHSLRALDTALQARGSRLIIRRGNMVESLRRLAEETQADTIYWNRRYEPAAIARDTLAKSALESDGLAVKSFNSTLLFEPWEIKNKSGKPFLVFTPYYRHCINRDSPRAPYPAPRKIPAPESWPASDPLNLLPSRDWHRSISDSWDIGEAAAKKSLQRLLGTRLDGYPTGRDQPGIAGTSRLSPHLHFGEISPHQIWQALEEHTAMEEHSTTSDAAECYIREIIWREYAYHLLFHFPHTTTKPLKDQYADFPWDEQPGHLAAWQHGQTGYPMVDAGMRELWHTGWMHNRVRMIVASFLIKHLLIPWQQGAAWFWDTLVDADLASNTMGWQWTAGCGADASPFFRIFNPTTQGTKFDPEGAYVRRWCPELSALPDKWIYNPSEAPAEVLQAAHVTLGVTYPHPIVAHKAARIKALSALEAIKFKE